MSHNILKTGVTLVLFLFSFLQIISGQQTGKKPSPVPAGFSMDSIELELHRLINQYRQMSDLPPIPLSKSLSYVAKLHAKDLFLNHPDRGACNSHSWSANGFWTPFCYPGDENKKRTVWDKPRELTRYPDKAYEIVYWENNPLVRDTIMSVWKTEEYFNNFLLNTGKWEGKQWGAIGIAVYENYACAWFGESLDPEGEPFAAGLKVVVPHPITSQPSYSCDSLSPTYYVIVKTNLSPQASANFVKVLIDKGFPEAKVLEKDGKLRISACESPDKALITAKLKEIKKSYRDAWLLKK